MKKKDFMEIKQGLHNVALMKSGYGILNVCIELIMCGAHVGKTYTHKSA